MIRGISLRYGTSRVTRPSAVSIAVTPIAIGTPTAARSKKAANMPHSTWLTFPSGWPGGIRFVDYAEDTLARCDRLPWQRARSKRVQ